MLLFFSYYNNLLFLTRRRVERIMESFQYPVLCSYTYYIKEKHHVLCQHPRLPHRGGPPQGHSAHCGAHVQKLRVTLRDKLLLVTFRTKAEGGEQALSHKEYLAFLRLILDTDCADLLDIEFFTAGADLPALIEQAHSAGVAVVCSSHDFAKTPPRAELVSRMVQMQQAEADLPKLAVMPRCRTDVLELLAATVEMADLHPETPVITMSMGALGAVSRLAGEAFGSAMTFANPGQASAPGQVSLDIVNEVLDALHL